MENTIDNAAQLVRDRIAEIDAERAQLQSALNALGGTTTEATPEPRKRARKGQSKSTNKSRSKGTSRKNGGRQADVMRVVTEQPGINRKDLAKVLGTRPNYVYRVTNAMVAAGTLVLDGKGLNVAKATDTPKPKSSRKRTSKRTTKASK